MKKVSSFIVFIGIILSVHSVYSQTVAVDSTFGKSGMTTSLWGCVEFLDFDNHGNIIALGWATGSLPGSPAILKTDANGIIDSNFGTNGLVILDEYSSNQGKRLGLKITNENKILVILYVYSHGHVGPDDPPKHVILQFNEDGSFDENFGIGGEVVLDVGFVNVNTENDDFMLVASYEDYVGAWISKYSYNGKIDTTFGVNGKAYLTDNRSFNIYPNDIKILKDGSIIAAGYDQFSSIPIKLAFCKLSQHGNLVTNFANNGVFITNINNSYNKYFHKIIEENNGNFILTGTFLDNNDYEYNAFMCNFNNNGTINNNFGQNGFFVYGKYPLSSANYMILLNGDNYLLSEANKIISITNTGTLNNNFNDTGYFSFEKLRISTMKFQNEDKIIVGGGSNDNIIMSRLIIGADISEKPLKANAGGNQHFCFDGGDLKQAKLGGKPTAMGGTPPYTYRWWSNPANQLSFDDTTIANPTIIHSGGITVYVEVADSLGNTAIDSALISMSNIPYGFLNNPYYLPVEHTVFQGDSVWITTDTIINILGNSTCRWNPANGLDNSTICSGFWAKPTITTSYFLTVIDEYGCAESVGNTPIHKVYVDDVGIVETHNYASLRIYPNPTSGKLQVTSYELQENSVVEIYDVVGQCVFTTPNPSKGGESSTSAQFPSFGGAGVVIDVSHLASGMYFLKVDNKVVKFVKE